MTNCGVRNINIFLQIPEAQDGMQNKHEVFYQNKQFHANTERSRNYQT